MSEGQDQLLKLNLKQLALSALHVNEIVKLKIEFVFRYAQSPKFDESEKSRNGLDSGGYSSSLC